MPTIVALHGAGSTPEMWEDLRREAPDFRVVAPDLIALAERGDGTLSRLLADLAAVLPEGPLVLVGCSIGSQIALELAATLGKQVRGSVLVAPGPPVLDEEFQQRVRGFTRVIQHGWNAEVGKSMLPLLVYPFGPRYATIAARVERMFAVAAQRSVLLMALAPAFHHAPELLPVLHGPVRVLLGAANGNPVAGVGLVDGWSRLLGSAAVERVAGASEFLPMEKPEVVAEAIRAILADRPAPHLRS